MKIRQLSKRTGQSGGGAPRQAHLMGEPHMLAYINEAERQMFSNVVTLASRAVNKGMIVSEILTTVDSVLSGNKASDVLTPVIGLSTIPVLLTTEVELLSTVTAAPLVGI